MTMHSSDISRRALLKGATLTVGVAALLQQALRPLPSAAQSADLPSGTVHSFATGGVTFHTYVSPAQVVNVTAHIVEFQDQLILVDATFVPPTATEVAATIAGTGKPVGMAVLSHAHPDHWSGADIFEGVRFATLPEIREAVVAEARADGGAPANIADGPDLAIGVTEMSGIAVEFRHYENAEAPHQVVVVLPEQKVAIVQDLVYNGVFFAPGVDRANWIRTLEELRDDPACETLLVGHGLPTSRGDLDTAIAYIKVMDAAMTTAATPDEAAGMIKAAFPGYRGEFLLSLIPEYWAK
jgi:glyoxylase-like metal-dependent hydrolase (beta-lactamase superfamily II)